MPSGQASTEKAPSEVAVDGNDNEAEGRQLTQAARTVDSDWAGRKLLCGGGGG